MNFIGQLILHNSHSPHKLLALPARQISKADQHIVCMPLQSTVQELVQTHLHPTPKPIEKGNHIVRDSHCLWCTLQFLVIGAMQPTAIL